MNILNNTSRVIVAIASLSLILTYFVPIWRIDLFAPQYPEGLTMKIWLKTLTGDVEIINGLNHYIGMKHINAEMFPEFSFLIYVVGFYILLGLLVAYVGKVNILFWYLVFTAFGGAFSMFDFYRWGYEYGHNLDEAAAIKVPGFSYQPPLIGHKRLLNFDAYSFPDIGGWTIFIAASIMFIIWVFHHWNFFKSKKSSLLALFPLLCLPFSSCKVNPDPLVIGKDICHACKMGIVDTKFGAELITDKGKIFKFDDIGCLVKWIRDEKINQTSCQHILVADFVNPKSLINVHSSLFITSQDIHSPMNFNYAATDSLRKNEILPNSTDKTYLTWDVLFNTIQ